MGQGRIVPGVAPEACRGRKFVELLGNVLGDVAGRVESRCVASPNNLVAEFSYTQIGKVPSQNDGNQLFGFSNWRSLFSQAFKVAPHETVQ